MQKIFLCFFGLIISVNSVIFTNETLENDAKSKLESGFEKTAIGTVEIGIGVWRRVDAPNVQYYRTRDTFPDLNQQ